MGLAKLSNVNAVLCEHQARAIVYFEEAYELEPHDKPVLIHIERAKYYQDNPPPEYWDGVHTMTRKLHKPSPPARTRL
ncbi:MAG: hypothetical protein RLP02_29165 [Coleofasciculus sp. C2-GNP5-27]